MAGYRLLQDAGLRDLVEDARRAFGIVGDYRAWNRVSVAGFSAGAFLAAHVASGAERAALLAGVYKLSPLDGTTPGALLDSFLTLSEHAATPTLIAWGHDETRAFRAQSRWLAAQRRALGLPTTTVGIAGSEHYRLQGLLATEGPVATHLMAAM